ncbi:putative F-box/LRR-repeat/kelch-repeat protein At1g11620 [Nicotiana tabacum]|uniref:F-box/LRR-repeat/kelch-repeat protein At1g11620 n=1 Tax=Nicotiana tabacum TaxID=4097 RepID=A0AC58TCJ2_TOBAC
MGANIVEDSPHNNKKMNKASGPKSNPSKKRFNGTCYNYGKARHKSADSRAPKKDKKKGQANIDKKHEDVDDLCSFLPKKHNREMESKSRATSEAEMIISFTVLSKDVAMDIFSRLPTKSLGKLRCVCKEWKTLISDPVFKSLHRARSSQKPNIIFVHSRSATANQSSCTTTTTTSRVRTSPNFDCSTRLCMSLVDFDGNHNFDFTLTFDGWVNLLPSKGELICFVGTEGCSVYNPSSRELVKLACCTIIPPTCNGSAFGYIKERNEYILVNARGIDNDTGCEVMRWTDGCCLKDRSWKVISAKCPYYLRSWGFLVDDMFYWIGYRDKNNDFKIDAIVSFDLGKEEFGTMRLPEGRFHPERALLLMEMKEMLCLVDLSEDNSTMDIWMLKDSKNYMWVKEYRIDLGIFSLSKRFITPMDHREGKILMNVIVKSESHLEWYDVENKCFKRIDNLRSRGWMWCGLCTDGLFSLGS